MDLHHDTALTMMGLVLIIFLWMAAWTWLKFARHPEEQRENIAYATAVIFGYAGLIVAYLIFMHH